MRIELDAVLRHPRDTVFAAYRDDLPAFVEFMPNVRAIEVVTREVEGPIVRRHSVWHGSTELPAALASKLEARFLSWDDHATWDAETHACDWIIEPRSFKEAVRCVGRSEFIALGDDRTRLDMTGELSIALDRVRGLPSFLAGSLARTAETVLLRQLTANLESVCGALEAFLGEDTVA